jgi:protein CpxP
MRKLFLALALAVMTAVPSLAQNNKGQRMSAEQRTEMRIKHLDEKLSLSEAQKAKIREIYADFNKQNYPRDKRREAMKKVTADISAQLTPKQQAVYKEMIEKAQAERKAMRSKQLEEK